MPTSSTSLMVPIRVRGGMLALLPDSFVLLHVAVALSLVCVCVCVCVCGIDGD